IAQASNGKECIQFIDDGLIPDILLLDVSMPNGMHGYEVAQQIQKRNLPIKVIAVSVLDDLEAIKAMIRCGARGFVYKGDNFIGIEAIIQTVYEGGESYPKEIGYTEEEIQVIRETPIPWLEKLMPKEWEVAELIMNEHTQKEVSKKLGISEALVSKRMRSLLKKTKAKSNIGLSNFFRRIGLRK
ncbi:MAG: response regulator transcription factor, partial [Chitinophagaceae bacterium]|nr:response regulator transcription factor [Chitinophagaceae bacterium]